MRGDEMQSRTRTHLARAIALSQCLCPLKLSVSRPWRRRKAANGFIAGPRSRSICQRGMVRKKTTSIHHGQKSVTNLGSESDNKGEGTKRFGEPHVVVRLCRFGEGGKFARRGPIEFTCEGRV